MATKSRKAKQKVEVTWVDITSYGGWRSPEVIPDAIPATCSSVGYLVSRDKKCVRIAMNDDQEGTFGNVQVFPMVNVKKIKRLR